MVNGNPAAGWSWLGNDTPQNYLQFFNAAGMGLGNGGVLDVTFASALAPAAIGFALGLNSATGDVTNTATGLVAPASAVPEPGTILMVVSGIVLLSARRRYADKFRQ